MANKVYRVGSSVVREDLRHMIDAIKAENAAYILTHFDDSVAVIAPIASASSLGIEDGESIPTWEKRKRKKGRKGG